MPLRSSLLCCALLALFALPSAAPAQAPAPGLHSDNVSLVTKLPEAAGAASARFSPDGTRMYVSTWKGLLIYDISKPEDPQRLGFLPLPHFENEDVDVGKDFVVISNDPSEGVGVIYVVDVSDPSLPKIASVTPNGLITASATLGLPSKTGHIANCVQGCKYLWMTGTSQGVVVYEMVDKTPVFKTSFQVPGKNFTHDVFVDRSGIAWVTGGDGTFGYDTTADAVHPTLVYRSDEAITNSGNDGPNSPDTAETYPLDFLHHNSIRTSIQLAQPAPGAPGQTPAPEAPAGQPGGGEATPPQDTPAATGTTPAPAASKPAAKKKAKAKRRCRTVKVRRHGKTRRVRRCTKAKPKKRKATVNRYGSRTTLGGLGDVVAVTEEDYTRPTCNGQGSVQTWQIQPGEKNSDGTTKLKLLDMWTTELNELESQTGRSPATVLCSAHWFDEDRGLLAQGWYDQGVRFMDISDPTDIKQVGYWVTSGTFWAAYFAPKDKSIVYGLDIQGGVDVLRLDRSGGAARMATVRAPIRRSWLETDGVTLKPSSKWGYACPLIGSVPGAPEAPRTAQVPLD